MCFNCMYFYSAWVGFSCFKNNFIDGFSGNNINKSYVAQT